MFNVGDVVILTDDLTVIKPVGESILKKGTPGIVEEVLNPFGRTMFLVAFDGHGVYTVGDDILRQPVEGLPDVLEPSWRERLDERQRKEIAFATAYARDPHGTDGHHRLMLIARMAAKLDEYERGIESWRDRANDLYSQLHDT